MTLTTADEWINLSATALLGTAHREIHAATDDLTRGLLSELPGYRKHRAALRRLTDLQIENVAPVLPADILTTTLLEAAYDADGIPSTDVLAEAIAGVGAVPDGGGIGFAVNAAEIVTARLIDHARHAAIIQVRHDLDAAVNAGAARFLAGVTEHLVELVDQARKVLTGRGRIVDAEDAIAQGRVAEFQAHRDLGQAYADLRAAYRRWYPVASGGQLVGDGPDAYVWAVANPVEAVGSDLVRLIANRPYPDSADEAAWQRTGLRSFPWPPSWDDASAVWWFARWPVARPWAPSASDVVKARSAINTAVGQHGVRNRRFVPKKGAAA